MAKPKTYTTVSGDYFDLISYKLYGTEFYSDLLCYMNTHYANVWVFDAGVTLYIFPVTPPADLSNPPWVQISST